MYPAADNVLVEDSWDPALADRVFERVRLRVGSNWGYGSSGWLARQRNSSVLRFDLGERISGRKIRRAVLKLYPSRLPDDSDTEYAVNALATAWDADAVRTSNAPAHLAAGESRQGAPIRREAPLLFDVTDIVRNWADGTFENHGVILRDVVDVHPGYIANRTTEFDSMDVFRRQASRPRLELEIE